MEPEQAPRPVALHKVLIPFWEGEQEEASFYVCYCVCCYGLSPMLCGMRQGTNTWSNALNTEL